MVNELDSTVTSYSYDVASGAMTPVQIIPTLPESFTGDSRASEIEASSDGRFIYASSRGYDSVAISASDPETGWLTMVDIVRTRGKTPRFSHWRPTAGSCSWPTTTATRSRRTPLTKRPAVLPRPTTW